MFSSHLCSVHEEEEGGEDRRGRGKEGTGEGEGEERVMMDT